MEEGIFPPGEQRLHTAHSLPPSTPGQKGLPLVSPVVGSSFPSFLWAAQNPVAKAVLSPNSFLGSLG